MHRGKVDPGVSELPRGNEFSRDHVNRPLLSGLLSEFSLPSAMFSEFILNSHNEEYSGFSFKFQRDRNDKLKVVNK